MPALRDKESARSSRPDVSEKQTTTTTIGTVVVQEAKVLRLGSAACRELDPAVRPHESRHRAALRLSGLPAQKKKSSPGHHCQDRAWLDWAHRQTSRPEDRRPRLLCLKSCFFAAHFRGPGSGPLQRPEHVPIFTRYWMNFPIELNGLDRGGRGKRLCSSEVGVPAPRLRRSNVSIAQATIQEILGED